MARGHLDRWTARGALLAFCAGLVLLVGPGPLLPLHWITGGIGICMTYHRLLTHRSFALRPRWLEYLLTIVGTCASEGGPIGWVADHRRHHANSDDENDTHTPNEGFFWAHMGWWMKFDEEHGAHARILPEVGARTSIGTRSIDGSTRTTSFSRSCSWSASMPPAG